MAIVGSKLLSFARVFAREMSEKDITFIAASLAYYALISVIPLIVLSLVAISTFGGPEFADQIVDQVESLLSPTGQALLKKLLTSQKGADSATLASLFTLIWSAFRLFRGLNIAFLRAYGLEKSNFIKQLKQGLITVTAGAAGVIITVGIGAFITLIPYDITIGGISALATLVTLFALVLTLLPLYYILPDGEVTLREALPGTVFAAVGWTVLQVGFRFYIAYISSYPAYGIIGSVLLLAIFFYFAGLILLLGVILNVVLTGRASRKESHQRRKSDQNL